jgi:hypothetical protein
VQARQVVPGTASAASGPAAAPVLGLVAHAAWGGPRSSPTKLPCPGPRPGTAGELGSEHPTWCRSYMM